MALGTYASYLIAIRGEKYDNLTDSVLLAKKNLSSIAYSSFENIILHDRPFCYHSTFVDKNLNHKSENQTVLLAFLSFSFFLTTTVTATIRKCLCSAKFVPHWLYQKKEYDRQETQISVIVYKSIMTQTSTNI